MGKTTAAKIVGYDLMCLVFLFFSHDGTNKQKMLCTPCIVQSKSSQMISFSASLSRERKQYRRSEEGWKRQIAEETFRAQSTCSHLSFSKQTWLDVLISVLSDCANNTEAATAEKAGSCALFGSRNGATKNRNTPEPKILKT